LPEGITRISVAKDFSVTPFGRHRIDGPESGEVFREDHLKPALEGGPVELDIDGVDGLPSSFWEEVMGGLVRHGISMEDLEAKLVIVCSDPELNTYVRSGWRFAREASDKLKAH
jgi:hypothetical protein